MVGSAPVAINVPLTFCLLASTKLCSHMCLPTSVCKRLNMSSCYVFVQGLEKGFDYKKVLKAFKKGERHAGFYSLPL